MLSSKSVLLLAVSAAALALAQPAAAQPTSGQERVGEVLGILLGQTNSLDGQWLRGGRPLNAGRAQFEARLNADVRSGAIQSYAATKLRADYDALVGMEARYAADGRFTSQERADLNARYTALTESLDQGGPGDNTLAVAEGRAEFEARVNAALAARRITRTQATALRSEYQAIAQSEVAFARDGVSARERAELDTRLDALDERLGDGPIQPTTRLSARERLTELSRAVTAAEQSGVLNRREAADLRAQQGDLMRLEAAYARAGAADDRAYLERRIGELEAQVQGGRRQQSGL